MKKERNEISGKVLALSDTHFGDRTQMLDNPGLVDRLMSVLGSRGDIEELILLGDVVDLWVATTVPALKQARYFIESLSRLPNVRRIVYIPGNHDYQMFMDAFRLEMDVRIMQGDLSVPKFMPSRSYGESLLAALVHARSRMSMKMVYPFIARTMNGRDVVFCHGHHLDYFAELEGWARTFWLSRRIIRKRKKSPSLHDIEMANIPFYGAMSSAPWVPELVDVGLRYYHVIHFFARLFRTESMQESPLRDSLIKENYDEIRGLLPLFEHPGASLFVYGHTHRPGIGKEPETGATVANTGAWVHSEEEVPVRTWVEVEEDVRLYTLRGEEAELIESAPF